MRKGGLLSPYLIVLSMERLGHWLQKRLEEGRIRSVRASRSRSSIFYLFFDDDLLLFSEADKGQLMCIREGLEQFCKSSGQSVNFKKSTTLYYSNMPNALAASLSKNFGFPVTKQLGSILATRFCTRGGIGMLTRSERVQTRHEG